MSLHCLRECKCVGNVSINITLHPPSMHGVQFETQLTPCMDGGCKNQNNHASSISTRIKGGSREDGEECLGRINGVSWDAVGEPEPGE